MSSILINGMEMPKNCWECHFGHGETGICVVDFKEHGDWDEPHDCPLVPVPPHGDLIDRDALKRRAEKGTEEHGRPCMLIKLGYVNTMPTIIPAEEE